MSDVPARLRDSVKSRAAGHCEYCRLSHLSQEAEFHIDHVVPQAAGGLTKLDNLALAGVSCSLRKQARQVAIDPQTGLSVPLFNPRKDRWREHFRWDIYTVEGLNPTGRATVFALQMNRPNIVRIREEETLRGRHPDHGD